MSKFQSKSTRKSKRTKEKDTDEVLDISSTSISISTNYTCINCSTQFLSLCPPTTLNTALPLPLDTFTSPSLDTVGVDNWTTTTYTYTYSQALSIIFDLPPAPLGMAKLDHDEDDEQFTGGALCDYCARNLATIIHLYQKTFCIPQIDNEASNSGVISDFSSWISTLHIRGAILKELELCDGTNRDIKPNIDQLPAHGAEAELQLQEKLRDEALRRQCYIKIQRCDTSTAGWQNENSETKAFEICDNDYDRFEKPSRRTSSRPKPKRKRAKRKRTFYLTSRPKQHVCPHSEGTGNCPSRGKMYVTELLSHLAKEHNEPGRTVCKFCQILCSSMIELRTHIQIHADERYEKNGMDLIVPTCNVFPCQGRVFYTNALLKSHKANVHGEVNPEKLHTCGTCGKVFTIKANMENHEKRIHSVVQETCVCEICGASFSLLERLKDHRRLHVPENLKIPCTFPGCSFKGRTPGRLRIHSLKHTGQPNFQCDKCPKSYKHEVSLRDHLALHANKWNYICCAFENSSCGNRLFTRRYLLAQHIQQVHGLDFNSAKEISYRPQSKVDKPYHIGRQKIQRRRKDELSSVSVPAPLLDRD